MFERFSEEFKICKCRPSTCPAEWSPMSEHNSPQLKVFQVPPYQSTGWVLWRYPSPAGTSRVTCCQQLSSDTPRSQHRNPVLRHLLQGIHTDLRCFPPWLPVLFTLAAYFKIQTPPTSQDGFSWPVSLLLTFAVFCLTVSCLVFQHFIQLTLFSESPFQNMISLRERVYCPFYQLPPPAWPSGGLLGTLQRATCLCSCRAGTLRDFGSRLSFFWFMVLWSKTVSRKHSRIKLWTKQKSLPL